MKNIRPMAYFSGEEQGLLQDRVFKLLGRHGVKMEHQGVMKLLSEAGAEVDFDDGMVRFPKEFLENVLKKAPKKLTLFDRNEGNNLDIPHPDGSFYFRTGTGSINYIDPGSGVYRNITISDIASWARLVNDLEQIDFCPFPTPSDVPSETADIHALKTMLQNTRKHVWVQPYSAGSIEYLIRLASIVAGGEEALKSRPLISIITCSLTPLEFKFMDTEIILQACHHGIPVHACSLPSAGGTAPRTIPGVVLLSSAEILAMFAMAQVIHPGTPVIAAPIVFSMDMSTGRSLQSSVEAMQAAAAAVQFMKNSFGMPTHTYGCGTDSPDIDSQSMIERSMLGLMIAISGADILGGAGQLEVATALSPLQLIIDNEVAGMIRRIISGLTINDETMAWEDLLNIPSGDHYLTTEHTLRYCRDTFRPKTFTRSTREMWDEEGQIDLLSRAKELWRMHVKNEEFIPLDEDVIKEMDSIVSEADRHLKT